MSKPTADFCLGFTGAVEEAVSYGFVTVICPFCGEPQRIEPDGYYDSVECPACGNSYKTEGVI